MGKGSVYHPPWLHTNQKALPIFATLGYNKGGAITACRYFCHLLGYECCYHFLCTGPIPALPKQRYGNALSCAITCLLALHALILGRRRAQHPQRINRGVLYRRDYHEAFTGSPGTLLQFVSIGFYLVFHALHCPCSSYQHCCEIACRRACAAIVAGAAPYWQADA